MRNQNVEKRSYARRLVMPSTAFNQTDGVQPVILGSWDSPEIRSHSLLTQRLCFEETVHESHSNMRKGSAASPQSILTSNDCVTAIQGNVIVPISSTTSPSCSPCFMPAIPCSPSMSPNSLAYAGARFNSSPSPKALPRPPSHWMCSPSVADCGTIESELKVMLRVKC